MTHAAQGIHPHFTLLCDDIRVEAGNRFSIMGIFQSMLAAQLPVVLIKFGVITQWHGQGTATTEVRVLSPDRSQVVMSSNAAPMDLSDGGSTYNLAFFVNAVFPEQGTYWVQTLLDSEVVGEVPFEVALQQHDS